jgi:deoxycytidylate deaminase
MPKKKYLALYMPVLHKGYLKLFEQFKDVSEVLILDHDSLTQVDYIRKDLRALSPLEQQKALKGLGLFNNVSVATPKKLTELDIADNEVILPDEDVSREFAKQFKAATITFYPIFLRWDRGSVENLNQEDTNEVITEEKFHQVVMQEALERAKTSSDIWRRVGAVLIAEDNKLTASNQGEPSAHSPWMEGDPRNIFNRGVGIEMSLFSHAEATVIAEAARRGIKLQGASIYASTFPCPACAKLIAHSGITTCYYKEGYAVLDGSSVLKEYGVQLVKVEMNSQELGASPEAVPYKK